MASMNVKPDAESQARARAEKLEAEGRFREAANIHARLAGHAKASALLERACDFAAAANQALLALDIRRAIELSALAGDQALCARAIEELVRAEPREALARTAGALSARGLFGPAAQVFWAAGDHPNAARAFAEAGDVLRAAHCFEQAGQPAEGARTLEAALRRDPEHYAARLWLGRLLARHGRTEAAVRALQKLPEASPEYAAALPLLARGLSELGLNEAAQEMRDRMNTLGISEAGSSPGSEAPPYAPAGDAGAPVLLYGRYALEREIASTPHARVVLAKDRLLGTRVAIKIYAASAHDAGRDALVRFEREASALSQLRHPNVVPLLAYVPEGPAMVLAWMAGGSLADRLRQGQAITPKRAAEIAATLLSVLGEAHRLGILHRDIKPSNVLFDDIGTPYLSDFGAAHLGDLSATATAAAIGTFAYMSPEQRRGQPATIQSDLYGVGALLYELLTGRLPETPWQPPSQQNPELGPAHDAFMASLLSEHPGERPADAFEARKTLLSCVWPDRPPKHVRPASPPTAASKANTPQGERLAPPRDEDPDARDAAHRRFDTWTDRDVLVFPLDPPRIALARAFARADHPALATVYRADESASELWVAPPRGRALADVPHAGSPGAFRRLKEAVDALHAAEGAHGSIDLEHVYAHEGELSLAFPRSLPGKDAAARDREALLRLFLD